MNLTKNQSIILLAMIDLDGSFRKEVERKTKMNIKSFHDSLFKLIVAGAIRNRITKNKGNPHKLFLTDYGKQLANSLLQVEKYKERNNLP